jgi:hypothetical protein
MVESRLTIIARQLNRLDHPVPIYPLMVYLGYGTCLFWALAGI